MPAMEAMNICFEENIWSSGMGLSILGPRYYTVILTD